MELQLSVPPEELTRAEQKILDFINTNTDSFLFLTIGQLAQRLDLSDATVSRFARHAGCRDFKALKARVLEQATGPAVKMAGTLRQEASFSPAAWLEQQQACLEKTAEQLSPEAFDQAVQAILAARRVWIHGKNASGALAQLLHFRLRRLGLPVTLLPAGGSELMEGLAQAGEGDLVILFSFSKLSREGKVILEHSRAAGYRTLAFVSRTCLLQEEAADIYLFAYRGTEKEYHSMAAPAALLDALVIGVTRAMGPEGVDALKALHRWKKDLFPRPVGFPPEAPLCYDRDSNPKERKDPHDPDPERPTDPAGEPAHPSPFLLRRGQGGRPELADCRRHRRGAGRHPGPDGRAGGGHHAHRGAHRLCQLSGRGSGVWCGTGQSHGGPRQRDPGRRGQVL